MKRYVVTLEIKVLARSFNDATAKIQKLAGTINAKDPSNKAWIPKIREKK